MSAPLAVIVAALVAAAVTLASQFVANELAVRRDRKHQRRERLRGVLLQAARALYVGEALTEEEYEAMGFHPNAVGALAPDQVRATHRFGQAWGEALTELKIELGDDDPLIDSYVRVAEVCARDLTSFQRMMDRQDEPMTDERLAQAKESARATRAAEVARGEWASAARARLEAI